jgi:hypothetical protein
MLTSRKQLEFPTTAPAFWEVVFEIGNDALITNVGGIPIGAQVFPFAGAAQPAEDQLVLVHNSGGDGLIVGIWLYKSASVWTRAPGFSASDVLPNPVIVQTRPPLSSTPRLWHIYGSGASIVPGQSELFTALFTQETNRSIVDLAVPNFAKHVCSVDVVNPQVTVYSVVQCGFVPLEDPPEAVNDFEELETMTISAIARNGFIGFFLYARGSMTGSYRVWYSIIV